MIILLALFLVSYAIYSQQIAWNHVDQSMDKIPKDAEKSIPALASWIQATFTSQPNRIRAVQRWLALNLEYDFKSYYKGTKQKENAEIITSAFRSRKAVCGGYAGLMDSLCKLMNIQSYVIDGYTIQDGKINPDAHAWVVGNIDEKWCEFDPTWSSGRLVNGAYEHEFDENYFNVSPSKMIQSHIPFDPIWQFLEYPIYSKTGVSPIKKIPYNFYDSIQIYLQLSSKQQIIDEIRRIYASQSTNQAVLRRIVFLNENLEVELYNENINRYNQAINMYNQAIEKWEKYINFRNKHKNDIQIVKRKSPQLDTMLETLNNASNTLNQLEDITGDLAKGVSALRKAIKAMKSQIIDEKRLMNRS